MRWFTGGGGGGGETLAKLVRQYSASETVQKLRGVNPKFPLGEGRSIAQNLYRVIKERGPLQISDAWTHAQAESIDGISSKSHLKILLKWMQGREMLKQFSLGSGADKMFLLCTLPEDPHVTKLIYADQKDFKVKKRLKQTLKKSKA